jgi:hypothetical protein
MILPRKLYRTADGHFCEEDDPAQAWAYQSKGSFINDAEAERIGLKAYLDETGWADHAREKGERRVTEAAFEKQIAQHETEDKAVAGPEEAKAQEPKDEEADAEPGPGLHIDPAARRSGRRGG